MASSRGFPRLGLLAGAVTLALVTGCHGGANAVLTDLMEARRLAADVRVQFNKASDASNRAVMADTDETSIAFAREAEQNKGLVKADTAALGPILRRLAQADEVKFLDNFATEFAEYEKLDRTILQLAVENTNLKAQRLSFGPVREAADTLRDSLGAVTASAATKDRCRVESLVAKAVVAVREIQVIQAPHIAESDDDAMTHMEREMAAREATARNAMDAIRGLVDQRAQNHVADAVAAMTRFEGLSKDLVKLSRRNSNVRSLDLSLRKMPKLTAACDYSLRNLQDGLAAQAFTATR